MARLLLVSTPERGHLNPLAGVAERLVARGHQVGWLCLPGPPPNLASLGVTPLGLPPGTPQPAMIKGGAALAALVRDPLALRAWVQALLLDAVPAQVEPVRKVLAHFAPDAVGLDPMLYQAVIAAELEGVRYLGISSSLNPVTPDDWECELVRTVRNLSSARAALFGTYGLSPAFKVCDALSPHGTTAFTHEAYLGGLPVPPRVFLVGPTAPAGPRGDEAAFPWERLHPGRPLVYCSFGSQISFQPAIFDKVGQAVARLGGQLVLNTGPEIDPGLLATLPGEAIAVPYAPQLALLERAAVMVSHGGANSVMEALRAGVPLLVSPVCNDQPLQARFLERSGAGRVLDLEWASVGEAEQALSALLDPAGPHRGPLGRLSEAYRSRDGALGAAERLEALAR